MVETIVAAEEPPSCSMVDLLRRVKRSVVGARVLPDRRCVWLPLVVVGPLCPQIPDVGGVERLFGSGCSGGLLLGWGRRGRFGMWGPGAVLGNASRGGRLVRLEGAAPHQQSCFGVREGKI